MGKAAKRHAENTYSWDNLANKIMESYLNILQEEKIRD